MTKPQDLGSRFYFHRSFNGGVLVLTSIEKLLLTQQFLDIELPYWLVERDKDLEIHAPVVLLAGELRLPGRKLKIVAQRIETQGGDPDKTTTISVDGDDGKRQQWPPIPLAATKPARAPDHERGAPGVNGRPGRSGDSDPTLVPGNGGSITLVAEELVLQSPLILSARGGKANAGEDGQPGGVGGDAGCQDEDQELIHRLTSGKHLAKRGGDGGRGGRGGDSGMPGAGGEIFVFVVKSAKAPTLTTRVDAGPLGRAGIGGAGAEGGLGGFGFGPDDGSPHHWDFQMKWQRGPSGPAAAAHSVGGVVVGSLGSILISRGATTPKAGKAEVRQISYADFLPHARTAHLSMLVDDAKADYLAERLDEAREGFGFLQSILSPLVDMKDAVEDSTALKRLLAVVAPFVDGLNNRTGYRLDFFHNDFNYVPMVSYRDYIKAAGDQLEALRVLEEANKSYFGALKEGARAQYEVSRLRQSAKAAIEERRDELNDCWSEIRQVAGNLTSANQAVDRTRRTMDVALADLKQKIVDHQECISFDDICRAIEMCAFVPPMANKKVSGGGVAMAGLQSFQLLSKGIGLSGEGGLNKSFMIRQLDRLPESEPRQALKRSYVANKGLFTPEEPNAVKLLAEAGQIDDMLADLESAIPSARECRQVIQTYVDAVTDRNDLILRYNEIGYAILQRQAEIAEIEGRFADLDEQGTQTLDLALPGKFASTLCLYRAVRDRVLKTLYLASRAHLFLRLAESGSFRRVLAQSRVKEIDYSVLVALKADLDNECQLAMEEAKRDIEPFPPAGREDTAQALLFEDSEDIAALREGQLAFSISVAMGKDLFRGQRNVRIREIRPWIIGLKLRKGLLKTGSVVNDCALVYVVRDGTLGDTFIDRQGAQKRLIYNSVQTHFSYLIDRSCDVGKIQQKATLTTQEYKDGSYALVGPFGYWRLQLDDVDRYDFSEVTGVRVEFFGASY